MVNYLLLIPQTLKKRRLSGKWREEQGGEGGGGGCQGEMRFGKSVAAVAVRGVEAG
jgi:hypothetical protein